MKYSIIEMYIEEYWKKKPRIQFSFLNYYAQQSIAKQGHYKDNKLLKTF